jgi:hypothetical protein
MSGMTRCRRPGRIQHREAADGLNINHNHDLKNSASTVSQVRLCPTILPFTRLQRMRILRVVHASPSTKSAPLSERLRVSARTGAGAPLPATPRGGGYPSETRLFASIGHFQLICASPVNQKRREARSEIYLAPRRAQTNSSLETACRGARSG